jgi:hypothetical protein
MHGMREVYPEHPTHDELKQLFNGTQTWLEDHAPVDFGDGGIQIDESSGSPIPEDRVYRKVRIRGDVLRAFLPDVAEVLCIGEEGVEVSAVAAGPVFDTETQQVTEITRPDCQYTICPPEDAPASTIILQSEDSGDFSTTRLYELPFADPDERKPETFRDQVLDYLAGYGVIEETELTRREYAAWQRVVDNLDPLQQLSQPDSGTEA